MGLSRPGEYLLHPPMVAGLPQKQPSSVSLSFLSVSEGCASGSSLTSYRVFQKKESCRTMAEILLVPSAGMLGALITTQPLPKCQRWSIIG